MSESWAHGLIDFILITVNLELAKTNKVVSLVNKLVMCYTVIHLMHYCCLGTVNIFETGLSLYTSGYYVQYLITLAIQLVLMRRKRRLKALIRDLCGFISTRDNDAVRQFAIKLFVIWIVWLLINAFTYALYMRAVGSTGVLSEYFSFTINETQTHHDILAITFIATLPLTAYNNVYATMLVYLYYVYVFHVADTIYFNEMVKSLLKRRSGFVSALRIHFRLQLLRKEFNECLDFLPFVWVINASLLTAGNISITLKDEVEEEGIEASYSAPENVIGEWLFFVTNILLVIGVIFACDHYCAKSRRQCNQFIRLLYNLECEQKLETEKFLLINHLEFHPALELTAKSFFPVKRSLSLSIAQVITSYSIMLEKMSRQGTF